MEKSISVSQLCGYIKNIFDAEELLHGISVYGEVSGFSLIRGNAYFTLKDDTAQLSCVFFGFNQSPIQEGEQVIVSGSPNFYIKGGKLNFNVYKMQPLGKGELYLKFLLLKEKLEKLGMFDQTHKKQLPTKINKIGVVTSLEGAVLQDIINVTTRRNPFVHLVVYPARVQGVNAYKTIIKGIKELNKTDVDLIIVARGGGSAEELSNFNNEELAYAVFESEKVIVSAVGHETDFTIIDFVADIRASTPSVAGEFVTKDVVGLFRNIQKNKILLNNKIVAVLNVKNYQFDRNIKAVDRALKRLVDIGFYKLSYTKSKLKISLDNFLNKKENSFSNQKRIVEKLNPTAILTRGYAKVEQNNKTITSNKMLNDNEFDIIFKDGSIKAKKV